MRRSLALTMLGLILGALGGCAGGSGAKDVPAATAATTVTTRDPRIPAGATLVEPGVWVDGQVLYGADCARMDVLRTTDGGPYGPYRSPDNQTVRNGYASMCFTG